MFMKKIDYYILKKFLGTFVLAISLIIFIVIVFDISEKLEDFIQKKAPVKAIIFDYYLNVIPYMVSLFSPLFTFIAVIFFTSRMAGKSEFVALLSTGSSFNRLLRPYFFAACIIALLSLILNNFIIPIAKKKQTEFEAKYIHNPYYNDKMNIHMQIEPGTFIYALRYDNGINVANKFSIEKKDGQRLSFKLTSDEAQWDSTKQHWMIKNYVIKEFGDKLEKMRKGLQLDTVLALHPSDFGKKDYKIETMNYFELSDFIADEKNKGNSGTELYEIEKYGRIAYPFATFILTLIGVSLSGRKVRGGIGIHIGLGLIIGFTFILFMRVSSTFAISGSIAPSVAVWIPNVLYAFIAYYLYKKAPK